MTPLPQRGILLGLLLLVAFAAMAGALQEVSEAKLIETATPRGKSLLASHASLSSSHRLSTSSLDHQFGLVSEKASDITKVDASGLPRPFIETRELKTQEGEISHRSSLDSAPDASERRDSYAEAATPDFIISPGMSNDSFADGLCNTPGPWSTLVLTAFSDLLLELPDCFYDKAPGITTLRLNYIIVKGNATHPDPLTRLPASLINLIVRYSRFIKYNTPIATFDNGQLPYKPDWTDFADSHPDLQELVLFVSGIQTAPEAVSKKLTLLDLSSNIMSGTIPADMLSRLDANPSLFQLKLGHNQLTGAIPLLFNTIRDATGANTFNTTYLEIQLGSNRLAGSLPAGLFAPITYLDHLYLDATDAGITGTIPPDFLSSSLKSLSTLTLNMGQNELEGTIPETLVSATTATSMLELTLDLSYNRLIGALPPNLFKFESSPGLKIVTFEATDNLLDGTVPNFFDSNPFLLLAHFTLILDFNHFTAFDPRMLEAVSEPYSAIINLGSNRLEGPLPTTFLANQSFTDLSFNVSDNKLTDNPFGALFNLPSVPRSGSISIYGSKNRFTGPVPSALFAKASTSTSPITVLSVYLDFSDNLFMDPLPDGIFGSCEATKEFQATLDISNNHFSGPVPSLWGTSNNGLTGISTLRFLASNNAFTGPLPETFFDSAQTGLKVFQVDLSSNAIESTLSTQLLYTAPSTITSMDLKLDNNVIDAGIPIGFFTPDPAPSASLTVSLTNCSITGRLPTSPIVDGSKTPHTAISLNNNKLFGAFNLAELLQPPASPGDNFVKIDASFNNFNESLVVTSPVSPPNYFLHLYVANNSFTSLSMPSANAFVRTLDLANNLMITGELPTSLFENSALVNLIATHTQLSGTMPLSSGTGSPLTTLDLSYSMGIQFCAPSNRSPFRADSLASCNLLNTQAVGCTSPYPTICFASATCDPKTRPSPPQLFTCINNIWTAVGVNLPPTITIPAGSATTVVLGNINSTTVIFSGIGATLVIEGCANNLTSITIELTPSEIETLSTKGLQALISYNSSNSECNDLNNVALHVTTKGSTCKRVKATPSVSPGQFAGLFTVDSSHCKTWWIILVSVLCGLLVIAIIIVILLITLVPSIRVKVRPYSKAREGQGKV